MKTKKKLSIAIQIFIALGLGIAAGLLFLAFGRADLAVSFIKPFGTIFLNLIKFIVVPIVLSSIICGVISMKDIHKVESIGIKTVLYYFTTTAFAIAIGLVVSNVFKGFFKTLETTGLSYEVSAKTDFMETLIGIFPSNIISPMLEANMLQVIVIALFFGFGIILAGEKGEPLAKVVNSLSDVSMVIMDLILKLSPIGVFCLMTNVVAVNGPAIVGKLFLIIAVAYIAYIIHACVVYGLSVRCLSGMSPIKFFKGMAPAMITAFTTTSSNATLPLTKECVNKLGAKDEVSSFVLPFGATINMDGSAIYQAVAAVFIACCYGIDLSIGDMAMIVLTATLASIGTAGVSGAGMIMLAMVLTSIGIPVEGIAIIAGVDKLFDMGRTTLNITGDATCALWISRLEEKRAAK